MTRAAAVLVATLTVLLGSVPGASAAAPEAQGWWNALHREGAAQPPAPPGVDPGELLVQGGDVLGRLPGQRAAQPRPLAVAALRFAVDPDSAVTTLDLPVDGSAVAQDVRAYVAATSFEPVENGAYDKAPDVVLDDFSQGVLSADGSSLSFPDISRLVAAGGGLSVVLVAGPGDRVVLKPPGPDALDVVRPPAPTPDRPDVGVGDPPPGAGAASPPSLGAPAVPRATSAAFAPTPGAPAWPPGPAVAAPPQRGEPAAAPVVRSAVARPVDDTRTRVLVVVEGLLVLAFFGLLGYGPFARLSRLTGLATTPRGAAAVRGIGRFSALRSGRAPRL